VVLGIQVHFYLCIYGSVGGTCSRSGMRQGASGDGRDVLMSMDSHRDPGSAVLNVLQFLDVLPSEEGISVVQSRGDKGVDELLCI